MTVRVRSPARTYLFLLQKLRSPRKISYPASRRQKRSKKIKGESNIIIAFNKRNSIRTASKEQRRKQRKEHEERTKKIGAKNCVTYI